MTPFNLDEVKAKNLPRATCASVGVAIKPKEDAENQAEAELLARTTIAEFDEYFNSFADVPDKKCPGCERSFGGWLGSFTWGLCYGQGHCANCGYPARAHHDVAGNTLSNLILPWHPDELVPVSDAAEPQHAE